MATAAEEALKVLMDFGATDTQFLAAEGQARAAQLDALSQPTIRDLQRAQPSAAELRRQQEAVEAQQADQLAAETLIKTEASKLGLNAEQQYLSRVSGEFDAVLRQRLQDLAGKARDDDALRRTALAQQLLEQDYELFAQLNAEQIQNRPENIGGDRVKDLASPDGFVGGVAKAAATAVAGIPGLAAIGAGAVGLEGTAQALGGAARTIQDLAPTDLGSSAAAQQAADIQARTESGELTLGEGASALARLAVTDGDFAADLLSTTAGAVAGGGAVTAGARGAARLAGAAATRAPAATTAAGRLAQGSAGTVAPVGVGLGSQVDENITTPQAQVLAGTIGASALVGGVTGLAGGAVAETALGNLARRVTPGVTSPTTGARTVGGALAPRSTAQQILSGTGRTGVSATGEAAQEFVESGGESLALSAREGLGDIDSDAIRRAQVAGTLAAPLGAGLGGAVGGASAVGQVRGENRATNAAIAADQEEANIIQGQRQEAEAAQLTEATRAAEASAQAAAVDNRIAELNARATELFGTEIEVDENTPRNQIGTRTPVVATFDNTLQAATIPEFLENFDAIQQDPVTLTALLRNQGNTFQENEAAFIAQVQAIPEDASAAQIRQSLNAALVQASQPPAITESRTPAVGSTELTASESAPLDNSFSPEVAENVTAVINSPQLSSEEKAAALSQALVTDIPDITQEQVLRAVQPLIQVQSQTGTPVTLSQVIASLDNAFLPEAPVEGPSATLSGVEAQSFDPVFAGEAVSALARQQTPAGKALVFSALLQATQPDIPAQQVRLITEQVVQADSETEPLTSQGLLSLLNNAFLPETTQGLDAPLSGTFADTLDPQFLEQASQALRLPGGRTVRAAVLSAILRTRLPDLGSTRLRTLSNDLLLQAESSNDSLSPEAIQTAIAEVTQGVSSPITGTEAPVLQEAVNDPESSPTPDPDPPATALPQAPILQEESTEVIADQVFDESGQVAAQFEQDLDIMAGPAGPSRNAARDGLPASRARSFRRAASQARAAKTKLDNGEPLTPTEQGHIIRAINLYREGLRLGNPEAPAEGATESSATTEPTSEPTSEQSSEQATPRTRQSRPLAPSSGAPVTQPNAQGLLPESVRNQVPQFLTAQDVTEVVNEIVSKWKSKPKITVVEDASQLPENLQAFSDSLGLSSNGQIYLIASNINDYPQIPDILAEEIFHRGILRTLGGNYDSTLDTVFNARGGVEGLLGLVSRYGGRSDFSTAYRDVIVAAQNGNKESQRELTDEVLAQIAISPQLPTGIRKAIGSIVAKVRSVLRRTIPGLISQYSDTDLHQLVRDANNAGREPGDNGTGPVVVRSSRSLGAGEYVGTDPTTGERRIFSALDAAAVRSIPTAQSTALEVRDGALARLEQTRADGLGRSIYRSGPWQSLLEGIANSRAGLDRVERELGFQPENTAEALVDELSAQQDLPSMLRNLLAEKVTPAAKKTLMSINSLVSTYASRGNYLARSDLQVNEQGDTMFNVIQRFNEAKAAIQNVEGLNDTETRQQIGLFATALHAPERNDIAWIRSVPLTDAQAEGERSQIIAKIGRNQATQADMVRLRELAAQFASVPRTEFVGSGMTDAVAADVLANINADPAKAVLYRQAVQELQAMQQAANEVKRQTGSFSTSLESTIELYGWQNYVPLRGRGIDPDEDLGDTFTAYHADNVFSSTFRAFEGRESLAEDVVGNVYKNAISSIEQYAAQDFIESVAAHAQLATTSENYQEAFKQDGENGKLLAGVVREFDINSPEFKSLMKNKQPANLVLYNKDNRNTPNDQRALVVTLSNPKGVNAVMGAKSELAENVDNLLRKASVGGKTIHDVTSFTASLKTIRNLPFIPFDALRNILTLGFVASTEGGATGLQNYMGQFTRPGTNYGSDIYNFVQLFTDNKFSEIAAKVQEEPSGIFAELDEFYRLGGPVNFLSAIRERAPGSLEAIGEETALQGRGIKKASLRTLRKMDNMFSKLNMTADTLSRFAFYKSLVDSGVPKAVAAARAKNTANFENRGTWSGPLGGLFEFFRATAAGSTALINSTLTGEYGRETAAAAFGAGAGLYIMASMFAGVDDEGDDRMASVNGALYNNNFVFQFGDKPTDRLQFGLGFGPIASSVSSGIHAARLMLGHADIENTLDNISTGIVNQYKVVPASSISPLDTFDFVASSITPSILKPWAEVQRNLSSLGIPVRSDYAGADSGDLTGSFSGRYSSEQEMYELVTQGLRNSGFANINPDDMRHIIRSYGGTMAYLAEAVFENVQAATSEDFAYNKKQGLYLARQFLGSTYSQQPADFYEHYKRIEDLDNQAKKFEAAGNQEAANAIFDSEIYAEGIDRYKSAKSELDLINKEYKPIFRLDSTTTAEKRRIEQERQERRSAVMRSYLQELQE